MSRDHRDYEIVDLYAEGPLTGSPLGVVPDAGGLAGSHMQAVARELAVPETAFVLPATRPEADYQVRVFTPMGESSYGGHSAVGTASTLVRRGLAKAGRLVQQCGTRSTPLRVDADGGTVTATDPLPRADLDLPLDRACGMLGLDSGDLGPAGAARVGFGPAFRVIAVRPDALSAAIPDTVAMAAAGVDDLFLIAPDDVGHETTAVRARLFAPGYGFDEDAACASATLALGVWLVEEGLVSCTDGVHRFTVHQGHEMGRPAVLGGEVTVGSGRTRSVSVTGTVLPAARGQINVPDQVPATPARPPAPAGAIPTP